MRIPQSRFFCRVLVAACLCVSAPRDALAAEAFDFDAWGNIRAAVDGPRETTLRAGLWVVGKGWNPIVRQESLSDFNRTPGEAGALSIAGDAHLAGAIVRLQQTIRDTAIDYRCSTTDAAPIEGVYWHVDLPIAAFAGGLVKIGDRDFTLTPAKSADARALFDAKADRVRFRDKDGRTMIDLTFDRAVHIRVQDISSYGEASFQLLVPIHESDLARGESASLAVTAKTTIVADISDATVTIDPAGRRSAFDGFGGNFVYGTDSPVTRATLDALRLTWARIPLDLREWEPTNDNGDPNLTNEAALAANDVESSTLRKRFELDRELFKRTDGRIIASIWYPPEWLFAEPIASGWREQPGTIPRERWPELAECITSYLERLKNVYGVEPKLLSFNESDQGVYVKLDGESTRDLAKLLAAEFSRKGLKTKLLLGDSADVAKGLDQIGPTLADKESRAFVGGLAYHPWAGQNEAWPKWADIAAREGLPLFTTEMGADADAWRDGSFASPRYTLRLARRYVEQLADARSTALLEWEWSDDYPMTSEVDGKQKLSPRGEWLKLMTNRTPQFGQTIATTVDRSTMRAATIARGDAWTVLLVNLDAERTIHVRGLPAKLKSMTLGVIDPLTGTKPDQVVPINAGRCDVTLPAGTMAILSGGRG